MTTRADDRLLASDACTTPLEHQRVDAPDVIGGAPTTGAHPLSSARGVEIGVWEITSGIVTDIETDEVFVVLAGRGRVDFQDGSSILLEPGRVIRLWTGDRTTWTIYETLRKIYILLPDHAEEQPS